MEGPCTNATPKPRNVSHGPCGELLVHVYLIISFECPSELFSMYFGLSTSTKLVDQKINSEKRCVITSHRHEENIKNIKRIMSAWKVNKAKERITVIKYGLRKSYYKYN